MSSVPDNKVCHIVFWIGLLPMLQRHLEILLHFGHILETTAPRDLSYLLVVTVGDEDVYFAVALKFVGLDHHCFMSKLKNFCQESQKLKILTINYKSYESI